MGVLLPLLLLAGAFSASAKVDKDGYLDQDMDAPMAKGEMDALSQAMGSERLEGMQPVGRKVSPDGKSGMIQFGNPNAEKEHWSPQFVASAAELERLAESRRTLRLV